MTGIGLSALRQAMVAELDLTVRRLERRQPQTHGKPITAEIVVAGESFGNLVSPSS